MSKLVIPEKENANAVPLNECEKNPYQCRSNPCPEREPLYCVSIKELTQGELEVFKELTRLKKRVPGGIKEFADVKNDDRFFVRTREELTGLIPDKEAEYLNAFDQYEELTKSRRPAVLKWCVEDADRARKRSETCSLGVQSATPETEQQEIERVACELWVKDNELSRDQIVEELKKRFGITQGVDAVRNWAKNHWNRETPDKPFPKRKGGNRKKT